MTRVLVLGGTNFIGPPVLRALVEGGHTVTVFHRGEHESNLPPEIGHIHGERAALGEHIDAIQTFAPEVMLDMRPLVEAEIRAILEVVAPIARRFVAISSMDTYRAFGVLIRIEPEPIEPTPLTEESPLRTRLYPYRADPPRAADDPQQWRDEYDKIPVEGAVMNHPSIDGTVLRLPMVYGPGDYQHRYFDPIKRIADGRSTILLDETYAGWRSAWGYVENVGAAIARAVTDDRAAGRIYNVADTQMPTMAERIKEIGVLMRWGGEVVALPADRLPPHLAAPLDFRQDICAGSSRIRTELDFADPIPLEEGLRRTIEWESNNLPEGISPVQFDYTAEDAALAEIRSAS